MFMRLRELSFVVMAMLALPWLMDAGAIQGPASKTVASARAPSRTPATPYFGAYTDDLPLLPPPQALAPALTPAPATREEAMNLFPFPRLFSPKE